MDLLYDVIIVGAGPAGMTAGIYAARAELKTLILEYEVPGGKLVKTAEIANWPGIASTAGADLALAMFAHLSELPIEYVYGEAIELNVYSDHREVRCKDGKSYRAKAVIIATGTKERLMGIANEQEMIGHGVSFCAVCDGAFYKDAEVVVVGGGNAAVEEALYLTRFAAKVKVVIRRDVFRADVSLVEELRNNPKIEVIVRHVPVAVICEDNKVSGLEIAAVDEESTKIIGATGIFPYIGADPVTNFVKDLGICDPQGYLLVDANQATTIPGIYGAGDVCVKTLRQVVTAANDGAIAAFGVGHYVK